MRLFYKLSLVFSALIITVGIDAQAQNAVKPSKSAEKEAKALTRDGWEPVSGYPSIACQLDSFYKAGIAVSGDGVPLYVTGKAVCSGIHFQEAFTMAKNMAVADLAGNIKTNVISLTDYSNESASISDSDRETTENITVSSRSEITKSLGIQKPVVAITRTLDDKTEVRVAVVYERSAVQASCSKDD